MADDSKERDPPTPANDHHRSHRFPVREPGQEGEYFPGENEPLCQVKGCERVGTVPRKLRSRSDEEPLMRHYVCRFHHRLFTVIKFVIFGLLLFIGLYAVYGL